MKRPKISAGSAALLAAFLVGLFLLVYPSFSDWWNSARQSGVIDTYVRNVDTLDDGVRAQQLKDAQLYNEALLEQPNRWHPTETFHNRYEQTLNPSGDGVMCWLEIPKIGVELPVYHGTDEEELQVAVGHIEGSSLPVGGASTHAVLSGHRGLPSARLLTDIDQLVEGDHFVVHTLGERYTYEVDQIRVVEPDQMDDLEIVEGQDLCTLVTCTPYGVNSHRLLVRGHRVANDPIELAVEADAVRVDPMHVVPFVAVPVLVALFVIVMLRTRKKGAGPSPAGDAEKPRGAHFDRKDEK